MGGLKMNSILTYENINKVTKKIKSTCKDRIGLNKFYLNFNQNIYDILIKLFKDEYSFSRYKIFIIREPKYRLIMSERLEDKIVNHLISNYILIPNIENRLIYSNVATRKNKGSKLAYDLVIKYLNKLIYLNTDIYALKIDISKYFYNIDHEILFSEVSKVIDDEKALRYIRNIIDSTNDKYVNECIIDAIKKEKNKVGKSGLSVKEKYDRIVELDKIPLYSYGKGLPIGNLSSQILAIFYLNKVDHFIKENIGCKYYVRYMDDLIIFDNDLGKLKQNFELISSEINKLKLVVNKKSRIYNLKYGVTFLGYNFKVSNNKIVIRYKSDSIKRINKRLINLKKHDYDMYLKSKISYKGYLCFGNTKLKDDMLEI